MKTILLIRHSEPIRDGTMPTAMLPLSEGGMKRRGSCSGGIFSAPLTRFTPRRTREPGTLPGSCVKAR